MDAELVSDRIIAGRSWSLISRREPGDNQVSINTDFTYGARYITFTASEPERFFKSYTIVDMFRDMLRINPRKESFANSYFMSDWESVRGHVIKEIEKDKRIPIVLSGHGLAGAIAIIAAYDLLRFHQYNIVKVVTFGAPRALNKKMAKKPFLYLLSQVSTNYVLKRDKLPKAFRFSRYDNIKAGRVEIDSSDEDQSSIEAYVKCLGVMS